MIGRLAAIALFMSGTACGGSDVSRTLGARCDELAECSERCLTGDQFPGGFCSVSCDDDGDCPGDSACVDSEGGVCLFSCVDPADCDFLGLGWTCATLDRTEGGEVTACSGE